MPVSVPVCHLDSRQQQPQQQNQLQQNNPPHLAYQQANHHSYTSVTTSNQHGGGQGVMGTHQQANVPPHLQQQVSISTATNQPPKPPKPFTAQSIFQYFYVVDEWNDSANHQVCPFCSRRLMLNRVYYHSIQLSNLVYLFLYQYAIYRLPCPPSSRCYECQRVLSLFITIRNVGLQPTGKIA